MADPTPTQDSSPPAYASAPRRSGLLYAIAGIVALAAAAALAIFMLGGRSPPPVVVTPEVRGGDAPKSIEWGGAIEYSLLYLQSNVHDQGFSNFVAHMTPVIEFNFSSPISTCPAL